MTTIQINNLCKTINKNIILDNISFCMESGNIYGFQGVNGSGKTMLMRAIIGLIRATSGSITINGKVLGKDIEFPKSIGFLLENPAFLDRYTGFENLKMLASLNGKVSDEQIKSLFNIVGLDDEAMNKKYRKYSLGMKQRLGIACSIMENPDIIVLDEPTNALDEAGIQIVKNILQEYKRRNSLIIISCHDISILREMSDEIIKLEAGKIKEHIILEQEVSQDEN